MRAVENSIQGIELPDTIMEMKYTVQLKPRAVKDIKSLTPELQLRIIKKIEEMSDNLKGDIKRLTDSTSEYRLRTGDYRILFEIEGDMIIIYRVRHRREAYQ